ncbi:flagellar basal body L-ring protein FlgH [Lyticum sinuosum]|nr:flagellar basal body L-ring protein FlgH [Lyticum sinuosum]
MNERLANVGRPPELSKVMFYERDNDTLSNYIGSNNYNPLYKADKKPVKMKNSVWSKNNQSFFENYRIGDIISIIISVKDKAHLNNQTQKSRKSDSTLGVDNFFGIEKRVNKYDTGSMISAAGGATSSGNGKIDRSETVETTIAATVLKILPSGNLYIKGSQEIRINYEIRQITVEGIVRHNDIDGNNAVRLDKIAEARISYGGRGHISEYQQDQYGKQIVDIVSPF